MTQAILNQIDFRIFQNQSKMEEDYSQETKDLATLLQTFPAENEDQQAQSFSQDNNVDQKKEGHIVVQKLKQEIY